MSVLNRQKAFGRGIMLLQDDDKGIMEQVLL